LRRGALLCLVLLPACGGNTETSVTASASLPAASVSVVVETSPVISTTDPERPLLAQWRVVIQNNGNVPAGVLFVNATLRDATSGAKALPRGALSLGVGDIVTYAGTNRVPAGGSLSVPCSLGCALPSGGREAVLSVAVQVLDDNGHRLTATAQADLR